MSISMSLGPFPWLILIGISKQDFLTWTPSSLLGLPPSTGVPGWDRSCCRRNVTEYSGKFVTKNVKMIFWNLGAPPWEFVGRRGRRRWWWCGVATLSPHLEDSNIHILNSISNNLTLTERRLSVRNLFGRGRGASVKKSNVKRVCYDKRENDEMWTWTRGVGRWSVQLFAQIGRREGWALTHLQPVIVRLVNL